MQDPLSKLQQKIDPLAKGKTWEQWEAYARRLPIERIAPAAEVTR